VAGKREHLVGGEADGGLGIQNAAVEGLDGLQVMVKDLDAVDALVIQDGKGVCGRWRMAKGFAAGGGFLARPTP